MALCPPLLHRLDALGACDWQLFSFRLPLLTGKKRCGCILRYGERWAEVAPLPGKSRETLAQAVEQLLALLEQGIEESNLLPSVQFGLESILSPPISPLKASLYPLLMGSAEEILQRAESAKKKGHRIAKVKLSSFSIAACQEIIRALKDRFRLRVDCNRAFSFDDAVKIFSPFDPDTFDYIEDPTFELKRLRDFPFPFALDEPLAEAFPLPLETLTHLCGFILKPTILGGKKGCARWIYYAREHSLKIILSPSFESGLGLLQILSLAQECDLLAEAHGLDTHRFLARDLLVSPPDFEQPTYELTAPPQIDLSQLTEIAHGTYPLSAR